MIPKRDSKLNPNNTMIETKAVKKLHLNTKLTEKQEMKKDNWYLRSLEYSVLTKEISKPMLNKELQQEILEIMISKF